ncbi:hypothetical protein GCM10022254_36250 [Actinomadura meridiana]|uniref:Uncharacterized protein n=1 Tax=Actinomadura meridiana TaxID=559626 RepID=A0ABP8C4H1_9ACTN
MAKSPRNRRCACGAGAPRGRGVVRALTAILRCCLEGTTLIGLYAMTPDAETILAVRARLSQAHPPGPPCCTGALPDDLRADWADVADR